MYVDLENILNASNPDEKIALLNLFYNAYREGRMSRETKVAPVVFSAPSYRHFCTVINPMDAVRRSKLGGCKGQIALLHSIAHIEYSAIDLALDAMYRFRNISSEFEEDWLKVAMDEARHFRMIEALLHEFGSYYGELSVHDGLFEASMATLTLLERMAVVPRYLEANGLDATPLILKKLEPHRHNPMVVKIMDALHIILEEEIDHVRRGDRWFEYACQIQGVDSSVYFEIIERYYPSSFPRKVGINCEARSQAGFSAQELAQMTTVPC